MNALYGVEAAALNYTSALHVQWNVTLWREVIDTIVVEEMVMALGARHTEAITAGESVRCPPAPSPPAANTWNRPTPSSLLPPACHALLVRDILRCMYGRAPLCFAPYVVEHTARRR